MEAESGEIIHTPKRDEWLTDLDMHYLDREPFYNDYRIVRARKEKDPDIEMLANVRAELAQIMNNGER